MAASPAVRDRAVGPRSRPVYDRGFESPMTAATPTLRVEIGPPLRGPVGHALAARAWLRRPPAALTLGEGGRREVVAGRRPRLRDRDRPLRAGAAAGLCAAGVGLEVAGGALLQGAEPAPERI